MDILDIWRLWKDVPQWASLGKEAIKTAVLTDVDDQVNALSAQWTSKQNTDEIRTSVEKLREYLISIATPHLGKMPTKSTSIDNLARFSQAVWARNELIKIYSLQDDGKLPPDPVPWSRRRQIFVNMRDALIKLRFQMESAMRLTVQDIVEAEAAEESIRRAAHDPFITQEELTMLDQDWKNWIKTDQDLSEWKRAFWDVARAARDSADAFSKIIDAGDRANRGKPK
jgi:hypothetical protein